MNQPALKLFISFFLFLFLLGENLHSQPLAELPIDTNYIDKRPSKYQIRIYTSNKQSEFYLFHQKWADRIEFHPAFKIGVGLGFKYKTVGLDLGVAVYRKGILPDQKTTGINLIAALYRGRNIVEINFQINRGFTETGDSAGEKINITRNDIQSFNFGVNYNYVFNYRKLSLKAAYSGTQVQKKSAGSPLIGVFVSDMNIIGDDTLISPQFASLINRTEIGTRVNVFSFGVLGGYAYTLVLPHRFYLTASVTPGITFSYSQVPRDSLKLIENIIHVAPKFVTREAFGYAGEKFYVAATFGLDINTGVLRNENMILYAPQKLKLVFGYRIDL